MNNTVTVPAGNTWKIFLQENGKNVVAASYDKITQETQFDWDVIRSVAGDENNQGHLMARVLLAAKDAN